MPADLVMPKLGLTMTEGTLVKWLKASGDAVELGESVAEIETDKIVYTLDAPAGGRITLLADEGTTHDCLAVLARVSSDAEQAEPAAGPAAAPPPAATIAVTAAATSPAATTAATADAQRRRVRSSPAARRLALEVGVDLSGVEGTGPHGLVGIEDVKRAAQGAGAEGAEETGERTIAPLSPTRRTIAQRMVESLRTTAQLTLSRTVDARALDRLRAELVPQVEQRYGFRLSYTDLVVVAVAQALARHPEVRVVLAEQGVETLPFVDIGIAVDVDGGLLVPVLRGADRRSLADVGSELRRLAAAARAGTLQASDVGGAVITVTNLGMFGVDQFTPILNPPESLILGVGRVHRAPLVDAEGGIVAGSLLSLSLTIDHRIVDGAPGARFLQTVAEALEAPSGLALRI